MNIHHINQLEDCNSFSTESRTRNDVFIDVSVDLNDLLLATVLASVYDLVLSEDAASSVALQTIPRHS
jgi:hypothetical protein